MWQDNLLNNLLVVIILISLGLVIYCKVSDKKLTDLIIALREATTQQIE